jgi:uncharacterized DUF497 family protein
MKIKGVIWLRSIVDKLAWKHNVMTDEVEEIFDDSPRYRFIELGDVDGEDLYAVLGQTDAGRYLIVYFVRKPAGKALIISARDMTKSERKLMARNKKQRDPIPTHFSSIAEASDFWDTHDLADYEDLTKEVQIEADIQSRIFLTALEPTLAAKLAERAHKQGISTETLINVWLTEKLSEAA